MRREQIENILPNKKVCKGCDGTHSSSYLKEGQYVSCCPDGKYLEHEYNQVIEDCISALLKSEIGVIPSVERLSNLIADSEYFEYGNSFRIATAIRSLMKGEK